MLAAVSGEANLDLGAILGHEDSTEYFSTMLRDMIKRVSLLAASLKNS